MVQAVNGSFVPGMWMHAVDIDVLVPLLDPAEAKQTFE
jgi:hypothetical protein